MQSSSPPRPRLPPLKALQTFDAAARHTSFAQGAAELGVTPSAVSHQIQLLETFLGVPLFRREGGRATLTHAGQLYANEIGNALRLIAEASHRVAPQSKGGHLVIASSPSFAAKWLQPRLPAFLAAHPGIKVRLFTFSSTEILDADSYDIAIAYGRPQSAQARSEPLLTERLRPLCSPGLSAALELATPNDLSRATLIHSVNALTWSDYLHHVGSAGLRPVGEIWLNPSSIAIDAAIAGVGVILESELLVQAELQDGRLAAPFAGTEYGVEARAYYLIRPATTKNASAVRNFESWLRPLMAAGNT